MAYQFEKIKKAILHASNVMELFLNDYRDLSEQEKVFGTHAVLSALRYAKRGTEDVERYFEQSLIDEFKLNYRELKNTFRSFAEQWEDVYDSQTDFGTINYMRSQLNTLQALSDLQNVLDSANKEIKDTLSALSTIFDHVCKQIDRNEHDDKERQAKHDKWFTDYLNTNKFKSKKAKFKEDIISYVAIHGATRDAYRCFRHEMESNASELFNVYAEGGNVAKHMVEHRQEFSTNDVEMYFYFRYMYNELSVRVERFDYEVECSGEYRELFRNRACELFATEIANAMYRYGGISSNNRYAMVLQALIDMSVVIQGRNGACFKRFLNNEVFEENGEYGIADDNTITTVTRKIKNSPFYKLTRDDLHDSDFTQNEFERFSNTYWLCVSMINLIMEEDLREKGFAPYLTTPHSNTPNKDIFTDYNKLKILSSVLRGEQPEI